MPVSYDSLTYRPTATKRKIYVRNKYLKKPHYSPLGGITDIEKMIAQPAKQTLEKRLSECLKRLRKEQVAVTTTHHVSPRSRRRSRRRRTPSFSSAWTPSFSSSFSFTSFTSSFSTSL